MPEASREPSAARTIADAAVEVSARGARIVGFAAGAGGFAARPVLRLAWPNGCGHRRRWSAWPMPAGPGESTPTGR